MDNWIEKLNMMPLNFYLERHGDTNANRIIFYKTFLNQSDEVIKQFEYEQKYELNTTVSKEDYLQLSKIRKEMLIVLRGLYENNR